MNIFGLSSIFCFFKIFYGPKFRSKATFLQLLFQSFKIFCRNFLVPMIYVKKSPERLLETSQVLENQYFFQFLELFWLQLMVPIMCVKNFPKFV